MRRNLGLFLVFSAFLALVNNSLATPQSYAPAPKNYQELIEFLHFIEKSELAMPYAQSLFSEKNYWQSLDLIELFPSDDHYLWLWQAALATNEAHVYQNFLAYDPDGALTPFAVHQLYQLAKDQDTIEAYQAFMQAHPNAPESLLALEQAIALTFARAKNQAEAQQQPEFLEKFAAAFPWSPLAQQALDLAKNQYQQSISEEIAAIDALKEGFSDLLARKETVARKIYNEARRLEKQAGSVAPNEAAAAIAWQTQHYQAERRYSLLDNLFPESKVVSEMLDLEELRAFRAEMRQAFADMKNHQDEQFAAVAEQINTMTTVLQQSIAEEAEKTRNLVQEEANKTRAVVREESSRLSSQFASYEQQMQTLISQQRTENTLRSVSAGTQLLSGGLRLLGTAAAFSNPVSAFVSVGVMALGVLSTSF